MKGRKSIPPHFVLYYEWRVEGSPLRGYQPRVEATPLRQLVDYELPTSLTASNCAWHSTTFIARQLIRAGNAGDYYLGRKQGRLAHYAVFDVNSPTALLHGFRLWKGNGPILRIVPFAP